MSAQTKPRGRCPRLREVVSSRRRRIPPEDVYPVDPWRIVEKRFHPRALPQTEALFATSNGYLGIRATPEEGTPAHACGTFLNGFYETWPIVYGEEAFGFAKTGQTMLHVPDGTILKLYVDDEPFTLDTARIVDFERALDFRSGALERRVRFETPVGKQIEVRSRRLVSFEHRHLAFIRYEVTPLQAHASLVISSELVLPDLAEVQDGSDPRSARRHEESPLVFTDHRARDQRALFNVETRASGLRMACAMDHVVEADCPLQIEAADCVEDRGRVVFLAEATRGSTVRIDKFLAYHHSERADAGELRFRTHRTLDRAVREGGEAIFESQARQIERFWKSGDVEVEGAPEVQQAVRFNLFQIHQASARVEGFGIPAKGLTGLGYEGHYFWDTEIYVLPFLTYTAPLVARSLLAHRYAQLDQARRRAVEVGHPGALFPWRTINGEEASAYYAAGTAQYHIDADIVFAADRYVALSGDLEFLGHGFAEMAVETARLWADLGFYSDRKDGRFCIHGVTGPDEYNTVVNNNAYTNLMARENLRIAVRAVESLKQRAPQALRHLIEATGLHLSEIEEWRQAADAMYVPYDQKEGVHLQDDAFLDREVWDLSRTPPEKHPLLLHYHPLVIYRYQVIKQADVVLATFLLSPHFTAEEKRRVFDYYDPLTTGDSSLSTCIQSIMAAEIGYEERAYRYFADAVIMDLGDVGGNVKDGLHVASLGGTWMTLVHGFAGLREHGGELHFRPRLPRGWERLRFRLRVRDETLEVDARPEGTRYRLVPDLGMGGSLSLCHEGRRIDLTGPEPVFVEAGSDSERSDDARSYRESEEEESMTDPIHVIDADRWQAVIFDMDGVLTDTARVHARAWKQMFDDYLESRGDGGDVARFDIEEDYRHHVDGRPRCDGVRSFLESRGIRLEEGDPKDEPERETICGLGNRKNALFLEQLRRQGPERFEDAVVLVRALRAAGVPVAVISASRNAREVLEEAGMLGLFDARVDGVVAEEIGLEGKPAPDVFVEAARQLGASREQSVVIEDARAGVEAGRRGGFGRVIGVARHGGEAGLRDAGADLVVETLAEIEVAGLDPTRSA